jgi:hypothetical protein
MTTIRKIVTSQVDGNSANADNIDEIRPFGETSFYLDTSGLNDKLVLSMFDGQRTHLRSKVLGPGVLYGSNADSGDGAGFDTIKLIPDASLHYNDGNFSNDQYLVVDPTAPNHIHIRAGGTIDSSGADLFLGGEQTNVKISDGDDSVTIRTSDASGGSVIPKEWIFDNTGKLSFPIFGAIETVGMGWFGITNGESGGPISIVQKSINVAYTGQYLSDITLSNSNDWTTGDARISTSNLTAGTSYQWIFGSDGTLTLPGTATIVDTADVQAAGTKITVPLNAAGDTVDYVGGASVIEIPKNADTNQVQAGWIITFPDSTQRTVSGVVDGGSYWAVTYNEANPGLGAGTYPLDVQSPDYTVASAGAITLSKTGHSWSFDSDGKITMGAGVTIDTEGTMSQGDFNLTLPGITGTPQQFRFTDEGGVGEIVFPIGTRTDGLLTVTPADEDIVLQTNYRPTIPALATFGSGSGVLFIDIFENDDVTAAGAGWEINIGTELEPTWIPIVSTETSGYTFIIHVSGSFEFIQGVEYTVRKVDGVEKVWRFRAIGPLVAPGGAVLSSETEDLGVDGTYRDFAIELPSQDGTNEFRWEFDNSGDMIAPGAITIAGTLNTPLGSVVGIGIDTDTFVGLQGDTGSGVIIRATDDELNFIDWKFGTDGGLTTPYGLQISDQYIQHPATGNFISLNNDTGGDITVAGEIRLTTNNNDTLNRKVWRLWQNGTITFPDSTVQTTAWAGGRVVSVPASSLGTTGDTEGDLAFSSGYLYYCTADYSATPTAVSFSNLSEFDDGLGDHYIQATIADPSQLSGVLSITNIVENGVTSASEPVTSYSLISGNIYKFYLANTTNPWNSLQISTLQVVPNIWRRVAWSNDTW